MEDAGPRRARPATSGAVSARPAGRPAGSRTGARGNGGGAAEGRGPGGRWAGVRVCKGGERGSQNASRWAEWDDRRRSDKHRMTRIK